MDTLRQGVSATTSISVSLADLSKKMSAKGNKRQHFQKFLWLPSTINNLQASGETTLCFWFRGSSTFAGTNSVPRPAGTAFGTAFGTASNSPPRRSSDRVIFWER
jgi:hypothetical protein